MIEDIEIPLCPRCGLMATYAIFKVAYMRVELNRTRDCSTGSLGRVKSHSKDVKPETLVNWECQIGHTWEFPLREPR